MEGAIQCYEKALHMDPQNVHALNSRASLMITMNKPEEALANLTRSVELDATIADTYTIFGQYYLSIG